MKPIMFQGKKFNVVEGGHGLPTVRYLNTTRNIAGSVSGSRDALPGLLKVQSRCCLQPGDKHEADNLDPRR
jgi:hypothetical protein